MCLTALVSCREAVMHNLTEGDANRLLTALHAVKIDSKKTKQPDGKWLVEVPKAQALRAIRHLEQSRLLREIKSERPARASMLIGREEQRSEMTRALSREIEGTLMSIDGVLEARVHLQLPTRDPLFGWHSSSGVEGSASVLLVTGGEYYLAKDEIRALVSGAAGINPEKIAVVMTRSIIGEDKRVPLSGIAPLGKVKLATNQERLMPEEEAGVPSGVESLLAKLDSMPVQISISVLILAGGLFSWLVSRRKMRLRCIRGLSGSGDNITEKTGASGNA